MAATPANYAILRTMEERRAILAQTEAGCRLWV